MQEDLTFDNSASEMKSWFTLWYLQGDQKVCWGLLEKKEWNNN